MCSDNRQQHGISMGAFGFSAWEPSLQMSCGTPHLLCLVCDVAYLLHKLVWYLAHLLNVVEHSCCKPRIQSCGDVIYHPGLRKSLAYIMDRWQPMSSLLVQNRCFAVNWWVLVAATD